MALALLGACGGGPSDSDTHSESGTVAVPVNVEVLHRDEVTLKPRFSRLTVPAVSLAANKSRPAREVAWTTLRTIAATYGLKDDALATASITSVHDVGLGPVIATFEQRLGAVEIFRSTMTIAFDRDMNPIVAAGSLKSLPAELPGFVIGSRDAVAKAAGFNAADVLDGPATSGEYTRFLLRNHKNELPPRAKQVWFDGPKGLEPAWYVEVQADILRSFVISAQTGHTLFTNDMEASEAFTYRTFADADGHPTDGPTGHAGTPHPTGTPDKFQAPFVPADLHTLDSFAFSKNDPWLAKGATTTTGNNVDAFANLVAPDGFNAGDLHPALTGPNAFDYAYDYTQSPGATLTNQSAATVQLFHTLNFMHDWFYDAGYDETSHNAQMDNYGRGGEGGDPITAQAQDVGGRNNANASTPADGAPPRIRMYVFDGFPKMMVKVGSKDYPTNTTTFGPKSFLTTGAVQLAAPLDACVAPLASLTGKIALIDRGTCAAILKVKNAQDAGAIGVIIANNQPGGAPSFGAAPGIDPALITIPTLTLSQADGAALKAALPTSVTLRRDVAIDRDGALDTSIVSHEWGHTLSNRLIGNANGLTGQQGRGMGEGWSDFVALLTTTRAANAAAPSNPDWAGTFSVGGYVESGGENSGMYYGVRRVPYSVNFAKNALTFKHIEDGVPLPSTVATQFGLDGASNSEVHSTGEVWATMLWECYVSLLRDPRYTFDQANERMKKYLVASLKLTPSAPTVTEARDAVLSVAYASDKQDYNHFTLAFARRGAGVGAVSPDRVSLTNAGVKESFVTGADVSIGSAKIAGIVTPCNPYGILRNGEHGTLTVTLKNVGTDPLLGTTLALSSSGNQITFPKGAVVTIPVIKPFESLTTTVEVMLEGAAFGATVDTTIAVTDPDLAQPRTVTTVYSADYNYDVAKDASRVDLFDTPVDVFTLLDDTAFDILSPWKRIPNGNKEQWHVADAAVVSDHSLLTPAFLVNAATTFTFDHRFDFEAGIGKNFDAGVLEATADDGVTWIDIGALATPGYTGIVDFEHSKNPLKARTAFTGQSSGYPAYVTTTVSLGTAFTGKSVKMRFREGSDEGTGAGGWDIARVAVTGTSNTPFPARAPVVACAPLTTEHGEAHLLRPFGIMSGGAKVAKAASFWK